MTSRVSDFYLGRGDLLFGTIFYLLCAVLVRLSYQLVGTAGPVVDAILLVISLSLISLGSSEIARKAGFSRYRKRRDGETGAGWLVRMAVVAGYHNVVVPWAIVFSLVVLGPRLLVTFWRWLTQPKTAGGSP